MQRHDTVIARPFAGLLAKKADVRDEREMCEGSGNSQLDSARHDGEGVYLSFSKVGSQVVQFKSIRAKSEE